MTGIGWLTPSGPVGPHEMSSTWMMPPTTAAAPAKSGKGWRTWSLVAAAAVLLVGAGVGGTLALSSHKGSPSSAGTLSPAALAGQSSSPATTKTATPTATPSLTPTSEPTLPPKVSGWVIKNTRDLLCLNVAHGGTAKGARVQEGTCAVTDPSQEWKLTVTVTLHGLVYRQIRNVHSGLCLAVAGGSLAANAAVVQLACSTAADHSQLWRIAYHTATNYELQNAHSGMCADTVSTAVNSNVIQSRCIEAPVQLWRNIHS